MSDPRFGTRFVLPAGMRIVGLVVLLCACRPPGYGKQETPDAASEMTDGGGSGSDDAGIDAPPAATCDHTFRLDGHGTDSSVWLTGSFVSWADSPEAGAIELTLGVDAGWTGSYAFPAGTHQYKFIVNGTDWILDPTNPNSADDGMGHTNSVYVCAP